MEYCCRRSNSGGSICRVYPLIHLQSLRFPRSLAWRYRCSVCHCQFIVVMFDNCIKIQAQHIIGRLSIGILTSRASRKIQSSFIARVVRQQSAPESVPSGTVNTSHQLHRHLLRELFIVTITAMPAFSVCLSFNFFSFVRVHRRSGSGHGMFLC